jgi:hypothetical protein
MSKKHDYILTALHNILRDVNDKASIMPLPAISIAAEGGPPLTPIRICPSNFEDAVIILVEPTFPPAIPLSPELPPVKSNAWIFGYPQTRRELSSPQPRLYTGQIEDYTATTIHVSTEDFADQVQMLGVSGGGLYIDVQGEITLVGIQSRMEGQTSREHHNWLTFIPVSVFQSIIALGYDGVPLPLMRCNYFDSFKPLFASIFPLLGAEREANIRFVRETLRQSASKHFSGDDHSPTKIIEKYGHALLIYGCPPGCVGHVKLWTSWLELLVLSVLIDEPEKIDEHYIASLHKTRRLLYSGSSAEWTTFLKDIVSSNLSGLAENAVVLISNNREVTPVKTRSVMGIRRIIRDISREDPSRFSIDTGVTELPEGLKLIHIDGLHADCIVRNEFQYEEFDLFSVKEMVALLKETYIAAIAK